MREDSRHWCSGIFVGESKRQKEDKEAGHGALELFFMKIETSHLYLHLGQHKRQTEAEVFVLTCLYRVWNELEWTCPVLFLKQESITLALKINIYIFIT